MTSNKPLLQQPPFVMLKNDSSGYEGYCIDLIDELKLLMGFEYEIFEAKDGVYGNMNENMEWNGLIRELVDKVKKATFQFPSIVHRYSFET